MKQFKLTPKRKEIMETLNLVSLFSLLRYYPYRYEHFKLEPLPVLNTEEKITIEGYIIEGPVIKKLGNKAITKFIVDYDGTFITVITFSRFKWDETLKEGTRVIVYGKYNAARREILSTYIYVGSLNNQEKFKSIYSLPSSIYPRTFYLFVEAVYDYLLESNKIDDHIPQEFIDKYKLISLKEALYKIHFPKTEDDIKQAKRYLKYEELLNFTLLGNIKKIINTSSKLKTPKMIDYDFLGEVVQSLPFTLSDDQVDVLNEIIIDLKSSHYMTRLVQGDVGSGKTIVALLALLVNYKADYQGALMVPTDILARQHYNVFKNILEYFNVDVYLLVGEMKVSEKQRVLDALLEDKPLIVIGTHALISKNVSFRSLGLAVIDEQHRFGVKQRIALKEKGDNIDILYMTATPIPRTLASTIYMDMDVSTISQFPFAERQVTTLYINSNKIKSIKEYIDFYLENKNKLYVVCPAVEESKSDLINVKTEYDNIRSLFPSYNVALMHGKLSAADKMKVMEDFSTDKADILVTTTVIEVGIDVKSANIMIILNAERFGLAQIHQLRGRIGRDGRMGFCYLLSDSKDDFVEKRLKFMEKNNDGFKISEYDLINRGPGELLGTNQSGISDFRIANLGEDLAVLKCASGDAKYILKNKKSYAKYIKYVYQVMEKENNYIE